ncbi:hypothetical protein TNCV_2615191, partial [Trichonephila clavipes]
DCKAREKKQEEQKEKLRIEEQREKSRIEERKERLRFEQLRLDEQKRKDEFELEKLRIQTQSKTLKQKSSSPFVKKQEYKSTEKNRRCEAPGKFKYNKKDKIFPMSTNYNKHYEAPITKYESVQRYQDSAQKGYYNKNYERHSNNNASKHAQTNYSKSQKCKEPPKETCTIFVKEGLRTAARAYVDKEDTAEHVMISEAKAHGSRREG